MVPGAGLEPARCCHRGILSPLRLPISPPGHLEALVGIEPTMAELQSTALPLCYSATKMWTFLKQASTR
jgi:hypothetical protein